MRITSKVQPLLAIVAAGFTMMLLTARPAHAQAEAKPACGNSITACGCTITKSGTYLVANDLDATQGLTAKGDCIDIGAGYVQLNVQGFAILGNGTGVGIRVLGNGNHAIIEGGSNTNPASAQGVVAQWDVGIQINANNAVVELFKGIGGSPFQPDEGNSTAGVLIDGVSDCTVNNFIASFNGVNGVLVRNSSRIRMFNFTTDNNSGSGVQMQSVSNSTLANLTSTANGLYGLVMLNSDQNDMYTFTTAANKASGVSLGCEASGSLPCPANRQPSSRNKISNGVASGNTNAGILVNGKSVNNQITVTTDNGNQGSFDLVDGNGGCDKNQWFNNLFGSASQSCIH